MFYFFDTYGWYASQSLTDGPRSTEIDPVNYSLTTTDGEMRANWTGYSWVDRPYWTPTPVTSNPHPDGGKITSGSFWERFTMNERADIDIASQWDAAASNNAKKTAAKLRINIGLLAMNPYVNLNKNRTRDWVITDIEGAGLIAAGRALVILDTPITADEKYYPPAEDQSDPV